MPVRLSQGWRISLRSLFEIQLQTSGIEGRLARLTKRHRKPLREWLRQLRRRASIELDFEPQTAAQDAGLEKSGLSERGKVTSSILEIFEAANTAMNSNLEPKDDSSS